MRTALTLFLIVAVIGAILFNDVFGGHFAPLEVPRVKFARISPKSYSDPKLMFFPFRLPSQKVTFQNPTKSRSFRDTAYILASTSKYIKVRLDRLTLRKSDGVQPVALQLASNCPKWIRGLLANSLIFSSIDFNGGAISYNWDFVKMDLTKMLADFTESSTISFSSWSIRLLRCR